MTRRLVLAGVTLSVLGGVLVGPALADSKQHYLCVALPGNNPTDPKAGGVCLNWRDPVRPAS